MTRRTTLACALLVSSPAWAHSPGAMLISVGLIGFVALAGGFAAKRTLMKAYKLEERAPGALIGVAVAELIGLAVLWFFFIAQTGLQAAQWFAVAGYFAASATGHTLALRKPAGGLRRLGLGALLAMPVPTLAALFWFGLLLRLYEFLGG